MADNPETASKIKELMERHRQLDSDTEQLALEPNYDQIKLQRLKKEKLVLKDHIAFMLANEIPDIIA